MFVDWSLPQIVVAGHVELQYEGRANTDYCIGSTEYVFIIKSITLLLVVSFNLLGILSTDFVA